MVLLSQTDEYSFNYFIICIGLIINNVNQMNVVTFFVVTLTIYNILLRHCVAAFELELKNPSDKFIHKMQNYRRFYMVFLLNLKRHMFSFANTFLIAIQFVFIVLVGVITYLDYLKIIDTGGTLMVLSYIRRILSVYIFAMTLVYYWLSNDIILTVSITI